jgi:hypothetical protein
VRAITAPSEGHLARKPPNPEGTARNETKPNQTHGALEAIMLRKRNVLSVVLACSCWTLSSFALTACGDGDGDSECEATDDEDDGDEADGDEADGDECEDGDAPDGDD